METRTTLCQCTRCASVFEWNERKIIDAQNAKAYIQLLDSLICQMKNI